MADYESIWPMVYLIVRADAVKAFLHSTAMATMAFGMIATGAVLVKYHDLCKDVNTMFRSIKKVVIAHLAVIVMLAVVNVLIPTTREIMVIAGAEAVWKAYRSKEISGKVSTASKIIDRYLQEVEAKLDMEGNTDD